jgi:hypothetical protein
MGHLNINSTYEPEIAFLKGLKALLEKHNAVLCIGTEPCGYESSTANLSFDIGSHSVCNVIEDKISYSFDVNPEHIEKVINNLKNKL